MSENNFREERIEKLLRELRYEIERGLAEREIEEEMHFQFIFPRSQRIPNGLVFCQFRMRPITNFDAMAMNPEMLVPKLRVVK